MRILILPVVGLLAGCSTSVPQPMMSSWSDPACAAVARQRQADAAANGYDAGIQVRTGRDAYTACLDMGSRLLAGN